MAGARPRRPADDLALLLLLGGVLLLSFLLSPDSSGVSVAGHRLPTLCAFRLLTGHRCPGCGLTRAFTFVGHGRLLEAYRVHPLGPLLYALVAVEFARSTLSLARRLRTRAPRPSPPET